ncbi:MAG: U32 family peptidase, partial [Desulfobulbaceae bacterium]|nr:U32 family peptidase [Desulfobulbaceae bacterium]
MSTPPKHKTKHELLAPAGSIESFFAAMEAGADAVYCGLKEFSARAKAKNFTLADTERLTAYAHQQGRKLYVPLNTLIKEAELPRLIEVLAELASFSVDGLIIQDLGLWRLARQHFPELPLHASTQMTIHNAAGVKMLEQMGFRRAVLARELSLDEISAIRQQTKIELEHFVHGALCYSVSGQCLFSSYLTGNSGNRGRCAQPCRRRYSERGKSGFYFSTSDFCTIKLLPRLVAAGVMSFKIEGRMKNAEYVSTVVSAYRSVLDASPANQAQTIKEADEALAEAYGRATTTGLLKGSAPMAIAAPATKGGIGRLLGEVEKIQGNTVSLRIAAVVHVGDRLRIQPQSDLAGSAFTVQEMFVAQQKVKRAAAESVVRIATPFRGIFQKGDQVYKVSTGKGFTMSEEACLRRLAAVDLPQVPVQLTISCRANNRLTLDAQAAGCLLTKEYEVEMLPAAHSPLTKETLRPTFVKTGFALIRLEKFAVGALPAVVIKPSRLNEVRRDFYAALNHQVEAALAEQRSKRIADVVAGLLPALPPRV